MTETRASYGELVKGVGVKPYKGRSKAKKKKKIKYNI